MWFLSILGNNIEWYVLIKYSKYRVNMLPIE
jgi:hypothetical protein